MNYSEKTQNKAKEITNIYDEFEEVRDRLEILKLLDLSDLSDSDRFTLSIMYIVDDVIDVVNAMECKIEQDYIEKDTNSSDEDGLSLEESLTKWKINQ